jgi:Calcineurin-like phosphoesterase
MSRVLAVTVILAGVLLSWPLSRSKAVLASSPRPVSSGSKIKSLPANQETVVLVGAGDVATCKALAGAQATADLLAHIPGTIFVVGDLAIPDGSEQEFADCYGPTWGKFKDRTRPAPGNHEYHAHGASPYFDYFGAAAGDPGKGYYSYDLGAWHIVSLNSNCSEFPGGCGTDSPQLEWLRKDLAEHPAPCTLAYWHHPLFSTGLKHGNDPEMTPFWQALYAAGAEVVINGHDHDYERFAPQNPDGAADPKCGIREFVAGMGGNPSHRSFGPSVANSQARNANTFGVLKLTLHPHSYDWQFIPVEGGRFTDSGTAECH